MKFPIIRVASGTLAAAAIAVSSVAFYKSKTEYDAYEKEYDAGVEAVKASFPALPEKVFFDNNYISYNGGEVASSKSSYKNSYVYSARDAVVKPLSVDQGADYLELDEDENALSECISGLNRKGGAITFNIEVTAYGMSDIEIQMRTSWFTYYVECSECYEEFYKSECKYEENREWLCPQCQQDLKNAGETLKFVTKAEDIPEVEPRYFALENITDYIKIHINKLELKTENIELVDDPEGFSSLILQGTRLLKGINTITISTDAYNNLDNKDTYLYVMPEIRNMTVITNTEVIKSTPEEESEETEDSEEDNSEQEQNYINSKCPVLVIGLFCYQKK